MKNSNSIKLLILLFFSISIVAFTGKNGEANSHKLLKTDNNFLEYDIRYENKEGELIQINEEELINYFINAIDDLNSNSRIISLNVNLEENFLMLVAKEKCSYYKIVQSLTPIEELGSEAAQLGNRFCYCASCNQSKFKVVKNTDGNCSCKAKKGQTCTKSNTVRSNAVYSSTLFSGG